MSLVLQKSKGRFASGSAYLVGGRAPKPPRRPTLHGEEGKNLQRCAQSNPGATAFTPTVLCNSHQETKHRKRACPGPQRCNAARDQDREMNAEKQGRPSPLPTLDHA